MIGKILNCPICGKTPRVQPSDPGYYDLKTYHCCWNAVYADDEKQWNQYVAAMNFNDASLWAQEAKECEWFASTISEDAWRECLKITVCARRELSKAKRVSLEMYYGS